MDPSSATVVGDLVARARRSDAPALRAPRLGRAYDYARLCTDAWKTGNYLSHLGVHGPTGEGTHDAATVAVADDPVPEAALTFLGTALLGATTRFVPLPDGAGADEGGEGIHVNARALVVPFDAVGGYALPPGGQSVAYSGPPDDPSVGHFERDVWSENPTEPPDRVAPESVVLAADGATYAHADLLDAARRVADDWALEPGDAVAVRASLRRPGTVVAGLLAPLAAGATVLFPDDEAVGDCAVVDAPDAHDAPEERVVAPGDVL